MPLCVCVHPPIHPTHTHTHTDVDFECKFAFKTHIENLSTNERRNFSTNEEFSTNERRSFSTNEKFSTNERRNFSTNEKFSTNERRSFSTNQELWHKAGQGKAGQGRAGQGRPGQGRPGQARAGQGKAGQGRQRTWSCGRGAVAEKLARAKPYPSRSPRHGHAPRGRSQGMAMLLGGEVRASTCSSGGSGKPMPMELLAFEKT